MSVPEKSLVESLNHFKECHARWMMRRNRAVESPDYPDEWLEQQCVFCRYYIPLVGVFMEDYGACSNPGSVFDGIVRFEHDGCPAFAPGDWWQAATQAEKEETVSTDDI